MKNNNINQMVQISNSTIGSKIVILTIIFMIFGFLPLLGQAAAPTELWNKTWENSWFQSADQTSDGGYIIAGNVMDSVHEPSLIKVDSNGTEQWFKTIGLRDVSSVEQTSDGGYILTDGTHLLKLDNDCNKEWLETHNILDSYSSVNQTSDGGYILAGLSNHVVRLIRTDNSGKEQWNKTFGLSDLDIEYPANVTAITSYSVKQTSDGGYIIAGTTDAAIVPEIFYDGYDPEYGATSVWLIKVDSNGTKQWYKNFENAYNYGFHIISVEQTLDNGFILACGERRTFDRKLGDNNQCVYGYGVDALLVKMDSNGNQEWYRYYGQNSSAESSGFDSAQLVDQTSDGGYIVVGYSNTDYGYNYWNGHSWLLKVDSTGDQQWSQNFSISINPLVPINPLLVQEISNNGYIVVGKGFDFDSYLFKFGYDFSVVTNFNSNVSNGFSPLSIKFTDTSTGSPTSWLWDFGDGNTSTEQNPTYTYYKSGNYIVTLTASNSEGTDSTSQTISVNDLDFKVNPQKIRISDKVEFNASQYISSTGGSITWDFGDGKKDLSNNPTVYHNYSKPGSYTAKITITDSKGNVATKSQLVNVTIPVVLVHGFMSSSETWVDMSSALQKNDFEVWNFDYGNSSTQNPQNIVPKLSDFIDRKRNDLSYNGQKYNGKIDIVCHSMGAIVSRLYMEQYQGGIHGKEVRQWIGIAPAHGGSAGADLHLSAEPNPFEHPFIWIAFKCLTTLLEPEAIDELTTISDSVQTLSAGSLSSNTKYRVIAGWNPTHSTDFGWRGLSATRAKNASSSVSPYYWTYSGDMIIATVQSYNKNMQFEAFPPVNGDLGGSPAYEFDHVHITKSPKVINYVTECLKDIDKISSNKLPSDDEVSFFTHLKKVIKGNLSTKEQQVNFSVPKLIPIGSNRGSSLQIVSNSMTNSQDTSSSQEDVVLDVILEWDDGDVSVNLISPSGTEYSADSHASNVGYFKDENSLNYIISDPESGNWTAELIPEEYPGHDIHYNLTYSLESIGSDGSNYYPVANFTTNVTTGYAPLTVQFTDLSNNATSWKWNFGDGTNSAEQNPVHVYNKEGIYTVSLNSSNSVGYDAEVKTNYINVTDWNPWNDSESENGEKISLSEIQTAIYDWRFGIVLSTGEMVDLSRLQGLIYSWRFG